MQRRLSQQATDELQQLGAMLQDVSLSDSNDGRSVSNTPVTTTEQGGRKGNVEPERRHDVAKTEEATHGPERATRARRPNMRVQCP
jgi:hypothetical protein